MRKRLAAVMVAVFLLALGNVTQASGPAGGAGNTGYSPASYYGSGPQKTTVASKVVARNSRGGPRSEFDLPPGMAPSQSLQFVKEPPSDKGVGAKDELPNACVLVSSIDWSKQGRLSSTPRRTAPDPLRA